MAAGRLGSPASVLLPQPWVYQPHGTSDLDRGGIHPVRVHSLPDAAAATSLRIPAASTAGLRDGILPGICSGVRPAHGLYRERDRSAAVEIVSPVSAGRPSGSGCGPGGEDTWDECRAIARLRDSFRRLREEPSGSALS